MPDYSQGKIYTIRCTEDKTMIYVGSTTQPLNNRFCGHKTDHTTYLSQVVNNDWSDWYIELYEAFPCNNKEELNKREGEITRLIGTLNKRIAGRTQKEQYQEEKIKISERKKKYYEENKAMFAEKAKDYREKNKEKILIAGKQYRENKLNKEKKAESDKKYYENNVEKIKEYRKNWWEENKEKINEKRSIKIVCECGCETTLRHKARHLKSKHHQKFLNEKEK